ncbi:RNA polymerase sigma factor [bacterium]|nr:MAG: RNA polymerase sigma factor [bacterium]
MMNFSALEWVKVCSRSDGARGRPSIETIHDIPDAAQLHTLYLDHVYRYVARRLERREDVEDVCAEVFIVAFEQLPRFRGEVEVRLWLLGIARRKVADAIRKRVRRREIALSESEELERPDASHLSIPQNAVMQLESRSVLRNVLLGLKDEQREVLLLKYVEELSVEEIAVVMNRSKAAANSLLQRARAAAFKAGEAYFLDFQLPSESINHQRGEK